MLEGIRLSKEELRARTGCSERLAVRIGALLSKGLELTAAVVEEAVRLPAVEALLLSPALLSAADRLDTAGLRAMSPDAAALSVALRDGRRILALEEETLAEKVWLPAAAPSAPPAVAVSDPHKLFGGDEVARLKLTILTGVDPKAKIEAIRKLAYSPIPTEERGALALQALGDSDAEVRREAAVALGQFGLDRATAEALRDLSGGTSRQRALAVQKAASAATRLAPAERVLVAASLVAAAAFESEPSVLHSILAALELYAPTVASNPDALDRVGRGLVRAAAERPVESAPAVRSLIGKLAVSPAASASLWKGIEGVSDRRIKILFFEAIARGPLDADLEKTLCVRAAEELARGPSGDLESRRLADSLAERGDAALDALLIALQATTADAKPALVAVIDIVASGPRVSAAGRTRAASEMLRLLKEGDRLVRTGVMDSRLCWHPELDVESKARFAGDFLMNLHAYKASRLHDLAASAVRRMGFSAAGALRETVERSSYPEEREAAVDLLAETASAGGSPEEVATAIAFLRSLEKGDRIGAGTAVRAVGRACASPAASPETVRSVHRDFSARIASAPNDYDLFDGLAWVAASPVIDASAAGETALRLLDLVDAPTPALKVSEVKTDEGPRFDYDAGTGVHTDALPRAIRGLRRIVLAGRLADRIADEVVKRLCARYDALAEYREVWAPGNVIELADALGEMAAGSRVPAVRRVRILETLLARLRNVSLARILGRALRAGGAGSPEEQSVAGRFVDRAFVMVGRPEYQDPEDHRALVEALGSAAFLPRLGDDARASDDRRGRIIDLLLERQGAVSGGRAMLRELAGSPHLTEDARIRLKAATRSA